MRILFPSPKFHFAPLIKIQIWPFCEETGYYALDISQRWNVRAAKLKMPPEMCCAAISRIVRASVCGCCIICAKCKTGAQPFVYSAPRHTLSCTQIFACVSFGVAAGAAIRTYRRALCIIRVRVCGILWFINKRCCFSNNSCSQYDWERMLGEIHTRFETQRCTPLSLWTIMAQRKIILSGDAYKF